MPTGPVVPVYHCSPRVTPRSADTLCQVLYIVQCDIQHSHGLPAAKKKPCKGKKVGAMLPSSPSRPLMISREYCRSCWPPGAADERGGRRWVADTDRAGGNRSGDGRACSVARHWLRGGFWANTPHHAQTHWSWRARAHASLFNGESGGRDASLSPSRIHTAFFVILCAWGERARGIDLRGRLSTAQRRSESVGREQTLIFF